MTRREEYLENPLPSNDEAETCVLGATFIDNAVFEPAFNQLVVEDFYSPFNRIIYRAMCRLYSEKQSIDPITVVENMKSHKEDYESMGGVTRLLGMTHGLPIRWTEESIQKYITLIKDHSVSRRVIRLCSNIQMDILSGESHISQIVESMEAHVLEASTRIHTESKVENKAFFSLADIVPEMHQQFQNYHDNISTGVKTGMDEVDHLLDGGGLQNGGTYLMAGGEKVGKTSCGLDWCYNIAAIQGFHVPIVTLEMGKITMGKRLYSSHTGIPYYMFRPGLFDAPTAPMYSKALDGLADFSKIPISIADKLFSLDQIARHLRRVVEQGHKTGPKVGVAMIDYLQILSIASRTDNPTDEITRISRGLKILAMELEIPLIIMSNLNRQGLTEGQEPDTFNLRGSQQIAFDAEAVFFLHNPAYHPGKPYTPREITDITLILARQRNGPTGRINLKLIGPYMQFMTEKQFRLHFGDPSKDHGLPQSVGQKRAGDQAALDMWDEEENDDF